MAHTAKLARIPVFLVAAKTKVNVVEVDRFGREIIAREIKLLNEDVLHRLQTVSNTGKGGC